VIIDSTNGKLDEARQFADNIGLRDNLEQCISNLDYGREDMTVKIFNDFAPKSFYFVRFNGERFAGNGGIIFHGKHDNGGDSGSPTYSVCLNPTNGWSIHT